MLPSLCRTGRAEPTFDALTGRASNFLRTADVGNAVCGEAATVLTRTVSARRRQNRAARASPRINRRVS